MGRQVPVPKGERFHEGTWLTTATSGLTPLTHDVRYGESMIRQATEQDLDFLAWHDRHLQRSVMLDKIHREEVYVVEDDSELIGWARYNLFWDLVPFLTNIHILENHRRKRLGTRLIEFWEKEMRSKGYNLVLTSTQSDETAQFFYRTVGYRDAGVLLLPNEAAELILMKQL